MYNVCIMFVPVGIYEGCAFAVKQCGGFTVIQPVLFFSCFYLSNPAVNISCDYLLTTSKKCPTKDFTCLLLPSSDPASDVLTTCVNNFSVACNFTCHDSRDFEACHSFENSLLRKRGERIIKKPNQKIW